MGSVIWTQPAVYDLSAIAEYIELDKPEAAKKLVRKIFSTTKKLSNFPNLGKVSQKLFPLSYRELYIHPCRILYRAEGKKIYIVAVARMEQYEWHLNRKRLSN